MGVALQKAKEAAERGEVPVGAILVIGDEVFAAQSNARETDRDPTAHAEVCAIRQAAERLESWRLPESTLYVTTEPCLLCTGAIYLARIKRVIFGCTNPKGGALRFVAENRTKLGLNHSPEILGGIRELECAALLKDFFRVRRT